ncbi:hypothetical protein ACLFLI_09560 [Mammaliicoccus sciuri]
MTYSYFSDRDKFDHDEESGDITNFYEVMSELRQDKPYLFNQASSSNDEGGSDEEGTPPANNNYKSGGQTGNGKQKVDYSKRGKELANELSGKQKEE